TATQKTDVTTAINRLVTPGNVASTTSSNAKDQVAVTPTVKQAGSSAEKTDSTVANDAVSNLIELGVVTEKSDMTVGEKGQLSVQLKSTAPVGLAVVTLRFDPKVIKVGNVSAGKLFANGKAAPTITQSIDPTGLVLMSVAPAVGATVSGEGSLLDIEFEAVGA